MIRVWGDGHCLNRRPEKPSEEEPSERKLEKGAEPSERKLEEGARHMERQVTACQENATQVPCCQEGLGTF